jgi:hypothetical protein
MSKVPFSRRSGLLLALTAALALQLLGAASALGAVSWQLVSSSNTTVAPGGSLEYLVQIRNEGSDATDGSEVKFTATFPPGLEPTSFNAEEVSGFSCGIADQTLTCEGPANFPSHLGAQSLKIVASADPGAAGVLTALFDISGGGAPAEGHTADPVRVSAADPGFGIDAFDGQASDAAGNPYTQAAGHPAALNTAIDFNIHTDPVIGPRIPVEDVKDVSVDLPPGLVGSLVGVGTCTAPELTNGTGVTNPLPLCPPTSQVGVMHVRTDSGDSGANAVYNMVPPPGVPARFGFNIAGTAIVLDASLVRSAGVYHLRVSGRNTLQGIVIAGASFEFWGVPSDPGHNAERACAGEAPPSVGGPTCLSGAAARALFRNPTSCSGKAGLLTSAGADSWAHPGLLRQAGFASHLPPGYPLPPEDWGPQQGTEGCAQVPFDPQLLARPLAGSRAGEPAGFAFDLAIPQREGPGAIGQSDLRKAVVTLPRGVRVSPGSADGLGACSPAQIALETTALPSCPDSSKLATATIETPLLEVPVSGHVYLATPFENPFDSLIAVYIVASAKGVVVKLPGQVTLDPDTGQITATFDDNPQLPFSKLHLEFNGGPRAPLTLPRACGTYATHSLLDGWSGKSVNSEATFTVASGCGAGGFAPTLSAGTINPLAGRTSPFVLQLKRTDSDQELSSLSATLPPGLTGYLKGIPACPDAAIAAARLTSGRAQLAAPSCPAASQVGTVVAGAGAGANPFYVNTGRAYLAGPYKGAPLSLLFITPAVAGPFDLGDVVVQAALRVDQATAQITAVSDPLPSILQGIPLDLRDLRVNINRPGFTLNPTSCEPMSITASVRSLQGATANPSSPFQVGNCDRLGFKPRLSLKLKGGTTRSRHPALTAILRPRLGDANAARIQVALPHSEFLAQNHIRTICTRVQFAAGSGGGEQCPKGSVYGRVSATSPLFDHPLTGNVYLRSSAHPLPDMVLALHGPASQPIQVEAAGRIDSKDGGIRTTFAAVPDAPLTKVVLRLPGGKKSLLENSTDLCKAADKATVAMQAQSGRSAAFAAPLQIRCAKKGEGGKRRGGR